jgi:hypothetical protein
VNLDRILKAERGRIYLKTKNGFWKRFDKIVKEILEENYIKLKRRKFRVNGQSAWGGRRMGNGDEIWIYTKLPRKEIEKTLIYEIAGIHYEDSEVKIRIGQTRNPLEEIAEVIWQNKDCRKLIRSELDVELKGGGKKWK